MNRYGRVGEIFYSLIDVAPSDEIKQMLRDYAQGVFEDQREEEAASLEAEVVRAVVECLDQAQGNLLPTKLIVTKVNEDREEKDRLRPQRVGWALARLGFKKGRMSDSKGTYAIVVDSDLISRLRTSYDIRISETSSTSLSPQRCSDAQMLRDHPETTTLGSEHSEQLSERGGYLTLNERSTLADRVEAGLIWLRQRENLDADDWGNLTEFTEAVGGSGVVQHMLREGLIETHPTQLNKIRLVRR
jgi:hypothetical protein